MNIYVRYFDDEILVTTVEDALAFLNDVVEGGLNDNVAGDFCRFIASTVMYPKRFKVHGRSYFIAIKTTAANMEEFKDFKNQRLKEGEQASEQGEVVQMPGWYEASVLIKRALFLPETQKYYYMDAPFKVRLKATSAQDCYNRVMEHLRNRKDLNSRCQFPSIKGKNFECSFLGETI